MHRGNIKKNDKPVIAPNEYRIKTPNTVLIGCYFGFDPKRTQIDTLSQIVSKKHRNRTQNAAWEAENNFITVAKNR